MSNSRQVQEFYSIGEVCSLTDLKPHVLRYWESQFRFLNPAKNRSGNRVYKTREVELIMLVKQLLYTEKFTIDGARQRIDQHRRTGELRATARKAFEAELAGEARAAVEAVIAILEGKAPASTAPAPPQPGPAAGRGSKSGR
ncbi:MAG: MerR family transcriptional regulator [Gemmatimonadales bacterium]|nr:MerR family transcriptional regulator [Gemmatimonadales bacterium]